MSRGFLAVSAALIVTAIMLSPAMAYTISSSGKSPYTIGSGSPYQYTMGSGALQPYSIGSGSPYQYTMGSGALQPYSIGSGSPYQYTMGSGALQPYSIGSGSPYQYTMGSGALQPYSIGSGSPYQYTMGSGALQPYSIGMGTPASRIGVSEVKAPVGPVVTEPVVTEPVVTEPVVTEPVVTEPVVTEPPVVEPVLMNIVETAIADGNFNTLVGAVEAAGLAEVLSGEGPFTVFAPTDDAFAALGEIDLNDVEALTKILAYHVASGMYMAEDLAAMPTITTLEGSDLIVEVADEGVRVNGALVIQADIVCSNGVIHVIDAVLIPAEEVTEPEVTEPEVTEPEVIEPEVTEPEVAEPEVAEPEVAEPEVAEPPVVEPVLMNILETAIADGNFNTLVGAVEAAGLAEVLSGEGPFTVFAPTDDAFAALGEIDLNDVEALTKILAYHVASGMYMAEDLAAMPTITTLEGSDLIVEVADEGVRVNGALVIQADIVCSNGVIHVIDTVLIPAEEAAELDEMPPERVGDTPA